MLFIYICIYISIFCLVLYFFVGIVMAVNVCELDLQLPMQLVPITTDVVGSTPAQGEVYNIM